ncbi:hypothetical protein X756_25170 [Mesorhizobium sp. LSHC412B00]|nr:hypothetical protein X756_25170 [Mesorhizobium sp. LSHC412B00]
MVSVDLAIPDKRLVSEPAAKHLAAFFNELTCS